MKTKSTWLFVIILLAGCNGDVKPSHAATANAPTPVTTGSVTFEMKTVKQKIPDSDAPLGRWKINKTYPVIQPGNNPQLANTLNQQIEKLVNQYGCKKKGDEGFNGEVMLDNGKVFSMRYESMWLCGAMPHPDSTQGALNYNLQANAIISLDEQFTDNAARDAFTAAALKRLNQEITSRSNKNQMACSAVTSLGRFYVTPDALLSAHRPPSMPMLSSMSRYRSRAKTSLQN
jgi:hypothetical protein